MGKFVIQILFFALILAGCRPVPLPISTTIPSTQTAIPSWTLPPTITVLPTSTPYPQLQTDGPYLLFFDLLFLDNEKNLILMDADGSGRKYIELPKDAYIPRLDDAVSPNGKWVAYFTGTSREKPFDLTLNLLNLENKTNIRVANFLSLDYPKNFEEITELVFIGNDSTCSSDPKCILRILESEMITGIYRFDWSPNSEEIAFAAQIDGSSSDIYIYNLENQSIQRLTNEPGNIGLMIEWAPNGKKILYASTRSNTVYSFFPLHIADTQEKSIQNPKIIDRGNLFWFGGSWIDEDSYLLWDGGEGAPDHNFRYINTSTQQITQIWGFSAENHIINKMRNEIFLLTYPFGFIQSEPETGLYLVKFDGSYTRLNDEPYVTLAVGPNNTYFAMQINTYTDDTHPLVNIDSNGNITELDKKGKYLYPPVTSPDAKWAIVTDNERTYLYSGDLQIVDSWNISNARIIWRPDSEGAFLSSGYHLYYLSINNGRVMLINLCPSADCLIGNDYAWIP